MKQITELKAKHFIAWVRKQIRLNGRHAVIGFIGDHINNPLEMWLQELTGERYIPVTIDGFEVAGIEYVLSNKFEAVTMAFEGDLDELPECGYREVTAWETVQMIEQLIDAEDYLTMQPETPEKKEAPINQVHITWTTAPRVRMTANIDFPEYNIKTGETFYLVRSSKDDGTYYIVTWNAIKMTWDCRCPATKPCRHMKLVNLDCKARKQSKQVAASATITADQIETLVQDNELTLLALTKLPAATIGAAMQAHAKQQKPSTVDYGTRGNNHNANKAFSIMRQ